MKTVIYYFTATGNSLTTARRIADALGNCRLIPAVAAAKQPRIIEDADAVGFVFPVYFSDAPCLVRDLIAKMVFTADSPYIFAVPTCRGHAGACHQRLDQLLMTRGQHLSLAVNVNMPGNSYITPPEGDQAHLAHQDEAVRAIIPLIQARETRDYSDSALIPLAKTAYPNNFRGITAEEDKCTGCGVCIDVCPMENIIIRDGRAVIGDNCSTCLSCFHWCPNEAVWMSRQENIARRSKYRHPEVKLSDILAQKQ